MLEAVDDASRSSLRVHVALRPGLVTTPAMVIDADIVFGSPEFGVVMLQGDRPLRPEPYSIPLPSVPPLLFRMNLSSQTKPGELLKVDLLKLLPPPKLHFICDAAAAALGLTLTTNIGRVTHWRSECQKHPAIFCTVVLLLLRSCSEVVQPSGAFNLRTRTKYTTLHKYWAGHA